MKKKLIILLQVLIATVLIGTSVYAAIDTTLDIKTNPDTNIVKKGEEISVTLSLKDVSTSTPVDSVTGYINYDETVFEKLTVNSIVRDTNADTVTIGTEKLDVYDMTNKTESDMPGSIYYVGFNGSPDSGNDVRIVIHSEKGISADCDLITVKFKAKADTTLNESVIKYELFEIIAGSEDVSGITKNINVKIEAASNAGNADDKNTDNNTVNNTTDADKNNTATNNPNSNTNTNKNTTNTNKNTTNTNTKAGTINSSVDNTIASVVIPAAGAKVVIIPAVILILCAYVFYNRYMKYKEF